MATVAVLDYLLTLDDEVRDSIAGEPSPVMLIHQS